MCQCNYYLHIIPIRITKLSDQYHSVSIIDSFRNKNLVCLKDSTFHSSVHHFPPAAVNHQCHRQYPNGHDQPLPPLPNIRCGGQNRKTIVHHHRSRRSIAGGAQPSTSMLHLFLVLHYQRPRPIRSPNLPFIHHIRHSRQLYRIRSQRVSKICMRKRCRHCANGYQKYFAQSRVNSVLIEAQRRCQNSLQHHGQQICDCQIRSIPIFVDSPMISKGNRLNRDDDKVHLVCDHVCRFNATFK